MRSATATSRGELTRSGGGSGTAGLLVSIGTFRASQNMTQTTLSLLGRTIGMGGTAIGAIAAGANLVSVLTMVLITARIATGSARRAVFVGSGLMTASVVCFALPSTTALLTGAVLLGLAGGLVMPSAATAVADHASAEGNGSRTTRGRALALLTLILSISLALGPLYESIVLSLTHERLRAAYLAFLPVVAVGTVVARGGRDSTPSAPRTAIPLRESLTGMGSLFRNRRWDLALCGQAIYMIPFALVVVFAGLIGKSLFHASASTTQIGIAVFFVVSLTCRAVLTRRPAIAHRVTLFAVCIAASLGGIAIMACGHGIGWFVAALAVLGAPHGLCYPLALGLVSDSVPGEDLAQANAGFQAVSNLINVLVPVVFGLVIDHFGDEAVLVTAAVPILPVVALLWWLRDAG